MPSFCGSPPGLLRIAAVAQLVECVLGKDEVMGSSPISSFSGSVVGICLFCCGDSGVLLRLSWLMCSRAVQEWNARYCGWGQAKSGLGVLC